MQVAACWRTRWLEGTGRVVPNILIFFAFRGLTSIARSLALLCTAEMASLTVQLQLLALPQGSWLQYHLPIQRSGCHGLNDTLFSRGNMLYTTAFRAPLPAKTPVSLHLPAPTYPSSWSITYGL
jgi:hypothetical protein